MPVMSISHRETNGPYQRLQARVQAQVRAVLDVPSDYRVIFMQGGAHGQFAAVPLNLAGGGGHASATGRPVAVGVDTGFWARRAAKEHAKYVDVSWAASGAEADGAEADGAAPTYRAFPAASTWAVPSDAAFVHVCANETIHGLELLEDPTLPPEAAHVPIAADFTSTLLSRPVDVSKYGVLYCSGGKNLGPAGVTLCLVKDSLLDAGREHPACPSVLSYSQVGNSKPIGSIYSTPPTFQVYMLGLCLDHVLETGGVQAAAARAIERAELVYSVIDASNGFYRNGVDGPSRSRMSVPFRVAPPSRSPAEAAELETTFLREAEENGFRHIAGHPLFGGMRASLYHGVPDASVHALAGFMERFRQRHA